MFAWNIIYNHRLKSIFGNKAEVPDKEMLKRVLRDSFAIWQQLQESAKTYCAASTEEWKFSGEKYGWSFRISDSKRALIYLLPRDGFFKAAFIFEQKATDKVLASNVCNAIKEELLASKPYAEGRGIRIEVRNSSMISDIKKLLKIKVAA